MCVYACMQVFVYACMPNILSDSFFLLSFFFLHQVYNKESVSKEKHSTCIHTYLQTWACACTNAHINAQLGFRLKKAKHRREKKERETDTYPKDKQTQTDREKKWRSPASTSWWTRWGSTGTWAQCWPGQRCRKRGWRSGQRRACSCCVSRQSASLWMPQSPAWPRSPQTESWRRRGPWWRPHPPECCPAATFRATVRLKGKQSKDASWPNNVKNGNFFS